MAEFTQFNLTLRAEEVATQLKESGWFSTNNLAGIFAAAFAIKYHFDDFDPGVVKYSNTGSNYGYSSFDPDGHWEKIIQSLYDTQTPRMYYKNLIIYGLEKIGEEIDKKGFLEITDFI